MGELTNLLNQRLRLDDRELVGKRVERGQAQTARPGIRGDVAERSQRDAMMAGEVVKQAALAAVGPDLVVNVQEQLRLQHLDLEAHLVVNAVRAGQAPGMLVA